MTIMADMTGSIVAERYRLAVVVGEGGMGRVWRAHDQLLDREVAVKEILLPDGLTAEQRHELVLRARREAQAAARLTHRCIVTVHDVVQYGGKPWIIMEFISGHSLDQAIAHAGKLDWMQAAGIGAALADALAHAHAAGIVHRDLKPANVLLSGSRVVITDFGIARILDASLRLTASASLVGTPQYMPPEQIDGNPVEAPGDMWALGVTLFTAVEGHPPFDGPSLSAVWAAILTRPLPAPQHAGPLGPILADLMSKAPDQRPQAHTAVARLTALQHYAPTSLNAGWSAAGPVTAPATDAAGSRRPRAENSQALITARERPDKQTVQKKHSVLLVEIIMLRARVIAFWHTLNHRGGYQWVQCRDADLSIMQVLASDIAHAQEAAGRTPLGLSLSGTRKIADRLVRKLRAGEDVYYTRWRKVDPDSERHPTEISDEMRHSLLTITLDASGADLSALDLPSQPGQSQLEPLEGMIWNADTVWPDGYRSRIKGISRPLRQGVYQIQNNSAQ